MNIRSLDKVETVLFVLFFLVSVFCLGFYPFGLVGMDFDAPGFEYAPSIDCIKPVPDQILATANMRQFLTDLLNFWKVLSVFVLQFSDVLSISYSTCLGLCLPFLLLLLLLLDFFLDLLLFLLQLFCYFLTTVNFVQKLTG